MDSLFRRAARWDGVIPLWDEKKTPEDPRNLLAYIQSRRTDLHGYDVVIAGATSGGASSDGRAKLKAYFDAGATWWLESIEPWRFGWKWQGASPLEAMSVRVRGGPPRVDETQRAP